MEEEFRAILQSISSLTSVLGDRINFGEHPQGEPYPAIVLNTISDIADGHMNGSGGLSQGRVQVDCYAENYGEAKLISRTVISALHHYRGGGFLIITQLSSRDDRTGGSSEAERKYRVSIDFKTAWRPEQ